MKLTQTLVYSVLPVWVSCNEIALNISTKFKPPLGDDFGPERPWPLGPRTDLTRHDDNVVYESADYAFLYKIRRLLRLQPNDVFYDVGSGMGRVLCVMARRRVRKCVGIELFEPLCESAIRNAKSLRARRSPIEIVCGDAATADLSDGTVYFLYNPFGRETMADVLRNISHSLESNPRQIKIVYYNAVHNDLLAATGWLRCFYRFSTWSRRQVTLWKSVLTFCWISTLLNW